MSENRKKFTEAALRVFALYGVRKATMEEIAKAAEVSKPTLYAVFKSKDEALAATIMMVKSNVLGEINALWKDADTLEEKLDLLFEKLVVAGFDMLHNSPDPDAFDDSIGKFSQQAIEKTRGLETELLAGELANYSSIKNMGTTPQSYAAFCINAAMQAKRQFKSRNDLLSFLEELKYSILSVCNER